MKTKSYYKFEQRCDYYESDLELSDLLIKKFKDAQDTSEDIATLLGGNKEEYPCVGKRPNTAGSRKVLGGHLRRTIYSAFIKDIYEDFEEYIAEILAQSAEKGIDPNRFVGNVKPTVDARTLLAAGSWEAVVKVISDDIFRKLTNERSTIKVINGMAERLDIAIAPILIDTAMAYLDARHILVHRDGKPDQEYLTKYPSIKIKRGKIDLSRQFVNGAKKALIDLATAIDKKLIEKPLIANKYIHSQTT